MRGLDAQSTNRGHSWGQIRVELERFGRPKSSRWSAVGRVSARAATGTSRGAFRESGEQLESSLFDQSAGFSTHLQHLALSRLDITPRLHLSIGSGTILIRFALMLACMFPAFFET